MLGLKKEQQVKYQRMAKYDLLNGLVHKAMVQTRSKKRAKTSTGAEQVRDRRE